MQIRIVIIGEDNQTHPYEFPTYEDAINFLQGKLPKESVSETIAEAPTEEVVDDAQEAQDEADNDEEVEGKDEVVEEDKKKDENLSVE